MYIFNQIGDAMFNFDKYPDLIKTSNWKVLFYTMFIVSISVVTYIVIPTMNSYNAIGGYDTFIMEILPDFSVENNKVFVDEYTKINVNNEFTVIFDTSDIATITNDDLLNSTSIIFKVTPSYISSNLLGYSIGIEQAIELFEIKNKTDLLQFRSMVNIIYGISFLILMCSYALSALISLVVSAVWINMLTVFYKVKMTFKELLKLSVYVNTTPFLLQITFSLISMAIPLFNISLPSIIYLGIIVAYLHFIFKIFKEKNLYKLETSVQAD